MPEELQQLLSFDQKFYNLHNKLLAYRDLSKIQIQLFDKQHRFYGIPLCIFSIKGYIYIGNSSGLIRVFETQSQISWGCIGEGHKLSGVSCIDIMEDVMLTGHRDGSLVLWSDSKLVKNLGCLHDSTVTSIKILIV